MCLQGRDWRSPNFASEQLVAQAVCSRNHWHPFNVSEVLQSLCSMSACVMMALCLSTDVWLECSQIHIGRHCKCCSLNASSEVHPLASSKPYFLCKRRLVHTFVAFLPIHASGSFFPKYPAGHVRRKLVTNRLSSSGCHYYMDLL